MGSGGACLFSVDVWWDGDDGGCFDDVVVEGPCTALLGISDRGPGRAGVVLMVLVSLPRCFGGDAGMASVHLFFGAGQGVAAVKLARGRLRIGAVSSISVVPSSSLLL